MDRGKKTESDVAKLCGDLFLKDFVLEAPKFRTPGRKLHEVADALLAHDDVLIALQVKTRVMQVAALSQDGAELKRIKRRVEKAAEQVKTVQRAIDAKALETGLTLRGVRIPLANRKYAKIIGIVVIDVFNADGVSVIRDLDIGQSFLRIRRIPVHVFRECDFRTIAEQQDTLVDLINYLDVREGLLEDETKVGTISELDLFAVFKTRYPLIEECLRGTRKTLVVEPGLWESIQRELPEIWSQRNERMMPSYLVDKTIEEVHKCIGYDPSSALTPELVAESRAVSGPTTPVEYWEIMQRLGHLSRIERAQFGEKMYEKAAAADRKPFAFTMIYRPPNVGPIIYLCSNEPRRERFRRLRLLMQSACAYLEKSAAVGIATEALSSEFRSHDFCLLKNVSFPDPVHAKGVAQQIFAAPHGTSLDEWGNDYASRM